MDFDEYQAAARKTAIYPSEHRVIYPALGLAGETGEVMEKIKKCIRDNNGKFGDSTFREAVTKELGDVLWYMANLSHDLGISLQEVAQTNIDKLKKRAEEGKLKGSGDNR